MRDEGETKLTPQEQSLNEEIEKLQDQWPYLMNEIFFIDYLKTQHTKEVSQRNLKYLYALMTSYLPHFSLRTKKQIYRNSKKC